jgi:hypothetical protein
MRNEPSTTRSRSTVAALLALCSTTTVRLSRASLLLSLH